MTLVEILTASETNDNTEDVYEIGTLAKELNISTRTIRFYEEKGIVIPERRGGNRVFSKKDRARLMLALRGKRLGFSLDEIKEYLDLYKFDGDKSNITQLNFLIDKIDTALKSLEEKKEDIDIATAELNEMRAMAENLKAR